MATPAPTMMAGLPGWFAAPVDRRWSAPVLLVHGSFSHHQHFGNYLTFLATEGFDAYAVSLRGRLGVAPERTRRLRFRHYFDDLVRIVGELPAGPILIGHSLGALLALKVAELGRCRAVVLLNPAPPGMLTAQPLSLAHFALKEILRCLGKDVTDRMWQYVEIEVTGEATPEFEAARETGDSLLANGCCRSLSERTG